MYEIKLTVKATGKSHIWKEGGQFFTEEGAEFHAKQIRKMKDIYSKVEVVPAENKVLVFVF